jgi:hypothetical protein
MNHLNYQQEIKSDELYKRKQTMCTVLCAEKEMHVSVLSLACMGPRIKKIQIKNSEKESNTTERDSDTSQLEHCYWLVVTGSSRLR